MPEAHAMISLKEWQNFLLEFPLLAKHTGLSLGARSGFAELTGRRSLRVTREHHTAVPATYLPPSHPINPSHTEITPPSSVSSNSFTKIFTREAPAPHQAKQKLGLSLPSFISQPS